MKYDTLNRYVGNLKITKGNLQKYQSLTEVFGSVEIRAENTSLPALTRSGYVYINAENASLPALTKVGSVRISAENASLPTLTEVSGSVVIGAENASLPALTRSGSVYWQASREVLRERLAAVALHALATPQSLDMGRWHSCDTTHCIAGWAIHLAGDEGYELERKFNPSVAGLILLGAEAAKHFDLSDGDARKWLLSVALKTESAAL